VGPADEDDVEEEAMEEEEYSAQWGSFPPLEKGQTSAEWLPERRLGQDGPEEPSPASGDVVPKVALGAQGKEGEAPKKRKAASLSDWLMPAVERKKREGPATDSTWEPGQELPPDEYADVGRPRVEGKFKKMVNSVLRRLAGLPWHEVEGKKSWIDPSEKRWEELGLEGDEAEPMVDLLYDYGVGTPNILQATALPELLKGGDALLASMTGSGKTLAFLLPMLARHVLPLAGQGTPAKPKVRVKTASTPRIECRPQLLILAPSRELASQTARIVKDLLEPYPELNSTLLIGGANHARQDEALKERQPAVVIGTPGRVVDHASEGRLVLTGIKSLVLDEIDGLLSVSRKDHLEMLFKLIGPRSRTQTVLVSATGATHPETQEFCDEKLREGWQIIGPEGGFELPPRVLHLVNPAPDINKKLLFLKRLSTSNPMPNGVIVFCNNFERARKVAEQLRYMDIPAEVLSGNRSKESRERAVRDMENGKIDFLVATDVATRGLDFTEMTHVVNFELPGDAETYAHRAGRCGRMGRNGIVISLAGGGLDNVRLNRYQTELSMFGTELKLHEANVEGGSLGVVLDQPGQAFEGRQAFGRNRNRGRGVGAQAPRRPGLRRADDQWDDE